MYSRQVRGKKNLVLERALAGPLGLFVKFSTLQEYGVDRVFFLENDNVDSSQRNIVFLARGDKAAKITSMAGQFSISFYLSSVLLFPFPRNS
jgi:vacuolar protein sorting-associated protein 33A